MLEFARRGAARGVVGVFAIAVAAPPVLAQAPGPAGGKSLWGVFLAGVEWPGYIILAGSLALIAIIVEHFLTIRRVNVVPAEQLRRARQQIEVRRFRECYDALAKSQTYFARIMTAALLHGRHGFDAMHEAAVEKSNELGGRMYRKVEFMNIIGNLGPLLGLLGTVWGMIIAFKDLGGGASAGELSRGISLALVNTLLGLSLAIVGLSFFGWCRNRVESLTTEATVAALDLLEHFRPAPVAQSAPMAPAATSAQSGSAASPASAAAAPPATAATASARE